MSSNVTLKAIGLNYSPNTISLPEGSLAIANDVIIKRDNVIESRRGFKEYSNPIGTTSTIPKQLLTYKDRVLVHSGTSIYFDTTTLNDDDKSIFEAFSGSFSEVQTGLRIKYLQANKNLYFTTNDGIKRLSSVSASDFPTSTITSAGAIKALDFTANLAVTQGLENGFLPAGSAVAYRYVFGYVDANNNLILGAPSDSVSVFNYQNNLTSLDLNKITVALDNISTSSPPSLIDDGDYAENYYSPYGTSDQDLGGKISLLAEQLDQDIALADNAGVAVPLKLNNMVMDSGGNVTIDFYSGDPALYIQNGDSIDLEGLTDLTNVSISSIVAGPTSTTINTSTTNGIINNSTITISGTGSNLIDTQVIATVVSPTQFTVAAQTQFNIVNITTTTISGLDYFKITTNNPHGFNAVNQAKVDISGTNTTVASGGTIGGNASLTLNQTALPIYVIDTTNFGVIYTGTPTIGTIAGTASLAASSTGSIVTNIKLSALNGAQTITGIDSDISTNNISTITAGFPPTIQTANPHNLTTGQSILIKGSSLTGGSNTQINGLWTVTVTSTNQFTIPVDISGETVVNPGYITSPNITFLYSSTAQISSAITPFNTVAINTGTTIISNNYRNIVDTGNDVYNTALSDVIFSIPATAEQSGIVASTLDRILTRLKIELPGVISATSQTDFLTGDSTHPGIVPTTSANVDLRITIPTDLPSYYFVQVYRSRIFTAIDVQTLGNNGGIPVVPDDELRQVYEQYPTTDQIIAGELDFTDVYPDSLAQNNTNLYTNPSTGDGIEQSNNPPPLAKDINVFKNYTFFANTTTKQSIAPIQLLGITNIMSGDTITISNGIKNETYTFIEGVNQVVTITPPVAGVGPGDIGKYIAIFSANSITKYYFVLQVDGSNFPFVPGPLGAGTVVNVPLTSSMSQAQIASIFTNIVNEYPFDFSASVDGSNNIVVQNNSNGITNAPDQDTIDFTVVTTTAGNGENFTLKQVLLSNLVSPGQAIDETARSLVRVINKQTGGITQAYYISGPTSPPGQIQLEAKTFLDGMFYVQANNSGVGTSFNPAISPVNANITSISVANPTVVTTSLPHNLINGNKIFITNSNSTPIINGEYSVTRINNTSFTIPVNVTVAGTQASWSNIADVESSDNEATPNRIYFSKVNQPDAVPLLNYVDVGATDKQILRIFPLRDSLFIFKEDGLYRLSGQVSPFTVQLFDTSVILIAPDSIDVANNYIYGWTSKGITVVNETTSREISRPVDTEILRLSSESFVNFPTVTWGVGYDSDNSYTVYTNTKTDDTVATIAFRYSNLTNTFTNFIRTENCGLNLKKEDVLYMGSGDFNLVERERKSFDRTDYADKDFTLPIFTGAILNGGATILVDSVDDIDVGDVITQEQTLNIYTFNKLLGMLDTDSNTQYTDYLITCGAIVGDDIRVNLEKLAAKLDTDSGLASHTYAARIAAVTGTITANSRETPTTITTSATCNLIDGRVVTITGTQSPVSIPDIDGVFVVSNTGTFGTSTTFTIPVDVSTGGGTGLTYSTVQTLDDPRDLMACFNDIVSQLNLISSGTAYKNYKVITGTTLFEAVIVSVNKNVKQIKLNMALPFVVGDIQVYNSIKCSLQYSPITFGDPLMTKHISEATCMFTNRGFTSGTMSFSSDLSPVFVPVPFQGDGNGIFGHYSLPGFGFGFFGGGSNGAPIRTYIPRDQQRCRYLNIAYEHSVAREEYSILGITLTGITGMSTRGYIR